MSDLRANITEAHYRINSFLGVNEAGDGDTKIKSGEAAAMRNWRVTDTGSLKRRPGTRRVIGLGADFSLEQGGEAAVIDTTKTKETGLAVYPACAVDEHGMRLTGTPVTVSLRSDGNYAGAYFTWEGRVWAFSRIVREDRGPLEPGYVWYGKAVTPKAKNAWVQALWSGYVNWERVLLAVAGGRLFRLAQENGVWQRELIGYVGIIIGPDTPAALFGVDNKVYCLCGGTYKVWDGTELKQVDGYIPVVTTATAPAGGGTALERVNILTRKRRQRFSGNGVAAIYRLAENQIAGVSSVVVGGTVLEEGTGYSVSEKNGTVTFATAPPSGSNNVEITYTAGNAREFAFAGDGETATYQLPLFEEDILRRGTTSRAVDVYINSTRIATTEYDLTFSNLTTVTLHEAPAEGDSVQIKASLADHRWNIEGRGYAEFFNGANDNRVFFYGNASNVRTSDNPPSNKLYYSGVTELGVSDPTYFPDLNEIEVGDSSPVTALCRQYSRLLVFKENAAYSVYYDLLTLADGSVTSGFYISAVNRDIGCDAAGQAVLTENRARTPDGGAIYEWQGNSYGNVTDDQRNAKRISQRVQQTLAGFDLSRTRCFFDKIRHEYYAVCDGTAVVHNTELDAWSVYTNFPASHFVIWDDELYFGTEDGWLVHVSEDYADDDGVPIDCYWESGSLDFDRPWVRKHSAELWLTLRQGEGEGVTAGFVDSETGEGSRSVYSGSPNVAHSRRARLKGRQFSHYKLTLETTDSAVVEDAEIAVKYGPNVKKGSVER